METILKRIEKDTKTRFEKNNHILSFTDYLKLVESNPRVHLRGSAQYIIDTFDHFGKSGNRFRLFDMEFNDTKYKVVDQNNVAQAIYTTLQGFAREGINNKLILLHGPNGSAKSSIVNCITHAMETYSHTPDGCLFRFNWIFPIDKIVKGSLGLGSRTASEEKIDSFALLPDDEIAAKVPCELKDHPLLLIPLEDRNEFLSDITKSKPKIFLPEYLTKGSLSHKSNQIFQALLTTYKGDLKKLYRHIQVERFYISKRYRAGAVTIEPQMHVDASSRQITMDRNISSLPASLQGLSLYEVSGDLIDANRGVLEYADILKRPVDTFKYLLITCETSTVNLGTCIALFDTVMMGTTNELQLDAFKEFPDFVSFKARIELIRVPYLLSYTEEKKIYDLIIGKIAGNKFVTPHTTFVAALWAVLTRLKKADPTHYGSPITHAISELKPIEKARLYDSETIPSYLNAEERKHLKAVIRKMREEYSSVPYYEGRMGASAREIKAILYEAAANSESRTLGPLEVFVELENFVRKTSEHEFLRQDIKDGYHDCARMIDVVKDEYVTIIDREVRESMGLIQYTQYEEFLKKYIIHVSHLIKKEKIRNSITGKSESPDQSLIEEFEKIIGAPSISTERDSFRNNIISTIGAYSLDNPNKPVEYGKVFPEYLKIIENHYFEQQKSQMKKIGDVISIMGSDHENKNDDAYNLAKTTIHTMIEKYGYSEDCAPKTILFLVKAKYH